jgi:transcription factor TFIIIB component B''
MLPTQPRSKKGKGKMKLAPKDRTKASTSTRVTTPPLELVPELDEPTVAVPAPVVAESALMVAVPELEAAVAPKPKKALKVLPASHPSDKGTRKLADYCTGFRGRSQNPAGGPGAAAAAAAASKKRPRMSAADAAKAKQAKHAAARPGLEIVNGQMVIRALEIGGVDSDEDDDREEVDEESGVTSTYSSFTDRTRTERWGIEETRRFYRGLQQCGTDFSLMLTQFPGRTQKQLKNKFRKETKVRARFKFQGTGLVPTDFSQCVLEGGLITSK